MSLSALQKLGCRGTSSGDTGRHASTKTRVAGNDRGGHSGSSSDRSKGKSSSSITGDNKSIASRLADSISEKTGLNDRHGTGHQEGDPISLGDADKIEF